VVAVDGFENDLFLDEVFVFVGADPSGAGTQSRGILLSLIDLLNVVVASVGSHDEESVFGLLVRHRLVGHFVKVVMNNFAKINQSVLLDLNLSVHVNLDTRGVDNTEITDEVFAVLADNHELRLPQLLVVRDLVVVGLTFSNFEDTLSSID